MSEGDAARTRWINYAACLWAILFAAPHVWWALGVSAGFPGGERSYRFFMSSTWRYVFDLVVVLLCGVAGMVALALIRPRGFVPRVAAWIACTMLTVRGIGGWAVDGAADPVWWPIFLTGGLLFGAVACVTRTPGRSTRTPPRLPANRARFERRREDSHDGIIPDSHDAAMGSLRSAPRRLW